MPPAQGRVHSDFSPAFSAVAACAYDRDVQTWYKRSHRYLFLVNPGKFTAGGKDESTDVCHVCSHSEPGLTHLHRLDELFTPASSFLLPKDVLMLQTWSRLIWVAEAAPPISYKRFCIRYRAKKWACSKPSTPLPNTISGTVSDKIRDPHHTQTD